LLFFIPEATYYNWLKQAEIAESKAGKLTKKEEVFIEFLESIKKAVQKARQVNLAVIHKAAQDGSWQAAAWFLERTDFEHFGNKSKFEHTGKDGKPVTIMVLFSIMEWSRSRLDSPEEIDSPFENFFLMESRTGSFFSPLTVRPMFSTRLPKSELNRSARVNVKVLFWRR